MRRRAGLALFLVLGAGAAGAWAVAGAITATLERATEASVARAILAAGEDWAAVAADGLRVRLGGAAPDAESREAVLALAGRLVRPARIEDDTTLAPPAPPAPEAPAPEVALTLLHDGARVTLTGMVPASDAAAVTAERLAAALPGIEIVDALERVPMPAPEGWAMARDAALAAAGLLERGRVEAAPCALHVAGTVADAAMRDALVSGLALPEGCVVETDILVPRPLVSPYAFELSLGPEGARLPACTAPDPEAVARIRDALAGLGLGPDPACAEGLGAPTERWTEAVLAGISALRGLGAGRLVIADTEIRLVAPGAGPEALETAGRAFAAALPPGYALDWRASTPPRPVSRAEAPPPAEFAAEILPEGGIRLAGPLRTEAAARAVASYAAAQFGLSGLVDETGLDADLPDTWTARVMAALDALALMEEGATLVTETRIRLAGWTADPTAKAAVRSILGRVAGVETALEIEIAFDESAAAPAEAEPELPDPETCLAEIEAALAARQITFPSASTRIDAESMPTLDRIAGILKGCRPARFEIGGHTDDSGRASANMELSLGRAEAVVDALLARGVFLERMVAKGYGEQDPIADNETEEGRALNRRIGVRLVAPEQDEEEAPDDGG